MRNFESSELAVVYGELVSHDVPNEIGALHHFLVESLTDYAVFALSRTGHIVSWNVGAQRAFGYTSADVLDQPFALIFTPEDVASGVPGQELAEAMAGKHITHGRWHLRKDGSRFWGSNTVQTIQGPNGAVIGFTKLVRDNTEERRALEALSDSEQQLRLLIESLYEYAILSVDAGGRITSWNPGAQQLFGYHEADIVGQDVAVLYLSADRQAEVPEQQLRAAALHGSANYEGWVVRQNGTQFFTSSKLAQLNRGYNDELRGFVLVAHDITERHFAAVGLEHRAFHDQLTNIPNRAAFHEHVQRAIAARRRHPSHVFAVLFIDLDHFKVVNDRLGHNAADTLLQYTAQRLAACVRDEDVVARIGGDEFAILLNGVDGLKDAREVADRVTTQMATPVTVAGHELNVSASVGIAMCDDGHVRPEDILYDADVAMYAAKLRGRAGSVMYTPALQTGTKPTLQRDLREALRSDQLRVHYQPILALSSRRLVGFEALVRWQHPERGLLEPHEFIPLAETTDLIIAIDRWVLRQACVLLKRWQTLSSAAHALHVSVNLSPKQFSHPDLLHLLRDILAQTGIRADTLHLEITESAFMERSERTFRLLQEIRKLGIELYVDDFGTGYSSLAALQHMPVQGLKIDAVFVTSMNSQSGFEIVRSIATLAHHMGLTAVAEGIRTEEHLRNLEHFGCQFGQGFLFSAPLDADAATAYLVSQAAESPPPSSEQPNCAQAYN